MKKQIENLIREANNLTANHYDITCNGMCEELIKLRGGLISLLNQFDKIDVEGAEWEVLDSLLDDANEAVQRASDALETHHGGHTTQM